MSEAPEQVTVSDAFKRYAWLSVRVDQYYSIVRIYARAHRDMGGLCRALVTGEEYSRTVASLSLPAERFFVQATWIVQEFKMHGFANPAPSEELRDPGADMLAFAFRTCFCFQWSIFESFTKERVFSLTDSGRLPDEVTLQVRRLGRRTEQLFRYLDSGAVFGRSPFGAILPRQGWVPQFDEFRYEALDEMRRRRNALVHDMGAPATEASAPHLDERYYEQSMWILRKFAENIDHNVRRLHLQSGA